MLNKFISAYKMRYFKIFSNDFYGKFKRFENALCEPKFHPSTQLQDELKKLDLFIKEPMQIAIVGQFSSGKSTFLNAILGKQILPTGITPVTARLTHIRYGENYALRVDYKNGKELNLNVSEIGNFVDQRVFGDDVKELCIYAPSEILKSVNFIDTPGLNSLSSSDTNITKEALRRVCAVIWLSLIENTARASELESLDELLSGGDKTAICVLNQKDKLSEAELENSLKHASLTYGDKFRKIIAISAKQATLALEKNDDELLKISNFSSVLDTINDLFADENLKEKFVLKRCEEIAYSLSYSHENFAKIYNEADLIIAKFDNELNKNLDNIRALFLPKIESSFNEIKGIAEFISGEITASLKPKKMYKFIPKKQSVASGGLFAKVAKATKVADESYERSEYEMNDINADEIFSKLIYNDTKLAQFFRIYRRNLSTLENEIKASLDALYAKLEYKFMIYKSEFENIRKDEAVHSDVMFAMLRTYAGQVYEMFLRDFESVKFQKMQKISLFFEKLNLKIITNYESAIKIAVHFIKDKIEISRISYEKDPAYFSLFIPSKDEISNRVLTALNLYEFENEMVGSSAFLNKILNELEKEYHEIKTKKSQKLKTFIKKDENLRDEILEIHKNLVD